MEKGKEARQRGKTLGDEEGLTSVANTSIIDLNADLVGIWWGDLDVLDFEGLAGGPGNCCLGGC